jgi:hypothetical protein
VPADAVQVRCLVPAPALAEAARASSTPALQVEAEAADQEDARRETRAAPVEAAAEHRAASLLQEEAQAVRAA